MSDPWMEGWIYGYLTASVTIVVGRWVLGFLRWKFAWWNR